MLWIPEDPGYPDMPREFRRGGGRSRVDGAPDQLPGLLSSPSSLLEEAA